MVSCLRGRPLHKLRANVEPSATAAYSSGVRSSGMAEDQSAVYVLKIACSGALAGKLSDALMEYCDCSYVYCVPSNPDSDTLYTDEHFDRTGEHEALWNDSCVVADLPLGFEERAVEEVAASKIAQAREILQLDSDLRWWVEEEQLPAAIDTSHQQVASPPIQHGRFVFLPYQPGLSTDKLEVRGEDEELLVPIILDFDWAGVDGAMVFGDGNHPSTSLCVEWLEQNIKKNDKVCAI
eukprot:2009415-Pyramimonas_sp.AAC.1